MLKVLCFTLFSITSMACTAWFVYYLLSANPEKTDVNTSNTSDHTAAVQLKYLENQHSSNRSNLDERDIFAPTVGQDMRTDNGKGKNIGVEYWPGASNDNDPTRESIQNISSSAHDLNSNSSLLDPDTNVRDSAFVGSNDEELHNDAVVIPLRKSFQNISSSVHDLNSNSQDTNVRDSGFVGSNDEELRNDAVMIPVHESFQNISSSVQDLHTATISNPSLLEPVRNMRDNEIERPNDEELHNNSVIVPAYESIRNISSTVYALNAAVISNSSLIDRDTNLSNNDHMMKTEFRNSTSSVHDQKTILPSCELVRNPNSPVFGSDSDMLGNKSPVTKDDEPYKDTITARSFNEKLRQKYFFFNYLKRAREDFEKRLESPKQSTARLVDFEQIRTIGKGSFGHVVLVKHKLSGSYYAMKILNKRHLVLGGAVQYTLAEKRILQAVDSPFIVKLKYSFKDDINLYLVLELLAGGDMALNLKQIGRFSESESRFYAAQIVLALEYLHTMDIVYRDLKPLNIVMDNTGYLKIIDFNNAKRINGTTQSFVGTPLYLAPEVASRKSYNQSVDWWTLGMLIYEMNAGHRPFDSFRYYGFFDIPNFAIRFPLHFSDELKDLLMNLLEVDPMKRYGSSKSGIDDIKNHKWFSSIDWIAIHQRKINAPLIPQCGNPSDIPTCDFYQGQPLKDKKYSEEFAEF